MISDSATLDTGSNPTRCDGVIWFGNVDWWYHNSGHASIRMATRIAQHRHASAGPWPDRDRLATIQAEAQKPGQGTAVRSRDGDVDLLSCVRPVVLAPDDRV
jgi:hypothetical protein